MPAATNVESNVQQAVPFFWVYDLEVSRRFYVGDLGFQLTKHWIDEGKLRWCWLELGNAAIMLQEFWRDGHHRNVPDTKVGVGVSIAFTCKDALAIYRDLKARGNEATRPFVGNAMWVTQVVDPDGYCCFSRARQMRRKRRCSSRKADRVMRRARLFFRERIAEAEHWRRA